MSVEQMITRYSAEIDRAVGAARGRYPQGMSADELRQEARVWLWLHEADVGRWESVSAVKARGGVYSSVRRRLIDAERVYVAEREQEIPACGLAGLGDDGDEENTAEVLDRLNEQHPQDIVPAGTAARFPDSGDLGEYHYRCLMAEIAQLREADRELLIDYYVRHMTMQAMAAARRISPGSVSNRLSRIVSSISTRAWDAVDQHLQAHPADVHPASVKLSSGWIPGSFGGRA
jgi:DNA-directed RNA polymerase specialized sigma24 family protein